MADIEHVTVIRENDGAFYDILELANIARPVVIQNDLQGSGRYTGQMAAMQGAQSAHDRVEQ
ncbi:hypothetical protein D3C81_1372390 [compost metagenome]